jgi:hypothetical protein
MTNIYILLYLAHFFLEREMFQTKLAENHKTHIVCSVTFFGEGGGNRAIYEINLEKYCIAGQATDDKMALPHCVLCN